MANKLNLNWEQVIREQKESGKTIQDFCKEKGFSQNTFYLNRQKHSKQRFVKLNPQRSEITANKITLKYKDVTIILDSGTPGETLQIIFQTLGIV